METRYVTKTRKDNNGTITALCDAGAPWSPRTKSAAISDIEQDLCRYYVKWSKDEVTEIRVAGSGANKYLRTDRDETTRNNLADLPDC